jgi:hypothetical protein
VKRRFYSTKGCIVVAASGQGDADEFAVWVIGATDSPSTFARSVPSPPARIVDHRVRKSASVHERLHGTGKLADELYDATEKVADVTRFRKSALLRQLRTVCS